MGERYQVQLTGADGVLVGLNLATDPKDGRPLFETKTLNPIQPSVQVGEATYANFLPRVSGVYDQADLSDGLGKQVQVTRTSADAHRYYYAEWMDCIVAGQVQKGPQTTSISPPANSGALSGGFVLNSTPYLCLGRIVASYASGALTQVYDTGGNTLRGSAVFGKLGTESSSDSGATSGTGYTLDTSDKRAAQQVRPTTAGVRWLSRVDLKLQRNGQKIQPPSGLTATPKGTAGSTTVSYQVVAANDVGTTTAGGTVTTTTANATLATANYVQLSWNAVAGATYYKVYRTAAGGTPSTTGLIGTTTATSFDDTGYAGDSSSAPGTNTTDSVDGDVRLSVMSDLHGQPSMDILSSASVLANTVPTTAGTVTFRFDDTDAVAFAKNEPMWLVLDVASAAQNQSITWSGLAANDYTTGTGSTSADRGQTWTNDASGNDFVFTCYFKTLAETAYVGSDTSGQNFLTTTDGASYTADTYRGGSRFCVVGDRIVRDVYSATTPGCIEYSTNGTDWSETLAVGDPTTPITALLNIGHDLLVVKTDSVWAIDIVDATTSGLASAIQLYYGTPDSHNGVGSCTWKGTAYVPFGGKLLSAKGDFNSGWEVHQSIGPESLPEWDFPWGAGRVVAVAPGRHELYAAVSTSGGYRLLKSNDPGNQKWHGSIATLGDGTQTIDTLFVYDPGGTSSPILFYANTSNNVGAITLSRYANPAADNLYAYDTAHTGQLFLPRAHGNFQVNKKAWLSDAVTYFKTNLTGDYVDILWDNLDGDGWRRMPDPGRFYDTSILPYAEGLESALLWRQVQMTNSLSTVSPLILAFGLTFAVRAKLKQITFTVDAEDFVSAGQLGDFMQFGGDSTVAMAYDASTAGTRTLVDHRGTVYQRVFVLDAQDTLLETKQGSSRSAIQITAVQVVG